MNCSKPRISPRSVIGMLGTAILICLGMVQAVRAATGSPVPSNWVAFTLLTGVGGLAFCAFLMFYDRSYRICWGGDVLRVRLPGITWRFRRQDEIVVPLERITAVTVEGGPVMPALRNILVWHETANGTANVPLSPVLLAKSELDQILNWIAERTGTMLEDQ